MGNSVCWGHPEVVVRIEEAATLGLVLVAAEAPELGSEVSSRQRRLTRAAQPPPPSAPDQSAAELVKPPEPIDPVLLAQMLDMLQPNWTKRRAYYEGRQRLPGVRDEPAAYAEADSLLGRRFDCRV